MKTSGHVVSMLRPEIINLDGSIFTQHKRYRNNNIKNKKCLATQSIESMLLNRTLKVNHIIVLAYDNDLIHYLYKYCESHSLSLFSPSHVQDAKGFATCLLDFINSNARYLVSLMKMTSSDVDTSEQGQKDRLKHVEMTLEVLYHVIHNNPGVEMQCIGHFKLLFSLLGVQGASKAQHLALKVRAEV